MQPSPPPSGAQPPQNTVEVTFDEPTTGSFSQKQVKRLLASAPPRKNQPLADFTITIAPPDASLKQSSTSPTQEHSLQDKALQEIEDTLRQHAAQGHSGLPGSELKQAISNWLSHYPTVKHPGPVSEFLYDRCQGLTDVKDIMETLSSTLNTFVVADTLTADQPEQVFEQLSEPGKALQALLVFRHKLVSNTSDEDYQDTVAKLDRLIHRLLTEQYAQPLEQSIGLDIDVQQPGYSQYRRLAEIAGHPRPVTVLETAIIQYATRHPDSPLTALLKLDNCLATDEEAPNMVTWCLGETLQQSLATVAEQLELPGILPLQPEPPAKTNVRPEHAPGSGHRVRFEDQPEVIPGDTAHALYRPEQEAAKHREPSQQPQLDDITPLSRSDMASHLSVKYFDQMGAAMQALEQAASNYDHHAKQRWQELQMYAADSQSKTAAWHRHDEKYPAATMEQMQKSALLKQRAENARRTTQKAVDTSLGRFFGAHPMFSPEGRAKELSKLSFVTSGLVNKEQFIAAYERHLTDMVIQTLQPRITKTGKKASQYTDTRTDHEREKSITRPAVKSASFPPVYMKRTGQLRGRPRTHELMTSLSASTRIFHQAMEVDLDSPAGFCRDLMLINDPRLMIALRVRMEQQGTGKQQRLNWQARMKEVMLQHCMQRVNTSIKQFADEMIIEEFKPETPDLNNPKHAARAEKIRRQAGASQLFYFAKGEMDNFIKQHGYDHGINTIWADGLTKPDKWPEDLNPTMEKFLPRSQEVARVLKAQGLGK